MLQKTRADLKSSIQEKIIYLSCIGGQKPQVSKSTQLNQMFMDLTTLPPSQSREKNYTSLCNNKKVGTWFY